MLNQDVLKQIALGEEHVRSLKTYLNNHIMCANESYKHDKKQ
jgi:hypothetical protein